MSLLQILTNHYALQENYLACKLTNIKGVLLPNNLKFKIKYKILRSRKIIISFFKFLLFRKWFIKKIKYLSYKRIILIKNLKKKDITVSITKLPYSSNRVILSFCKLENNQVIYKNKFKIFESKNYDLKIIIKLFIYNFRLIKDFENKKKIVNCHNKFTFDLEIYG